MDVEAIIAIRQTEVTAAKRIIDRTYMVKMAEQVFRLRLAARAQERHQIDAEHTPFVGERAQLGIVSVARIVDERAATAVSDSRGRGAGGDPFRDGTRAGMAEIEHDPRPIDPRDHLAPEVGQASIGTLQTAVTDEVAFVVGELDDPDAKSGEGIDPGCIGFERSRILEVVDDAELAGGMPRCSGPTA